MRPNGTRRGALAGPTPHGWHYYGSFACPRFGYYQNVLRLVPPTTKALRVGIFAHAALEAAARGLDRTAAVRAAGRELSGGTASFYVVDETQAIRLVADYERHWARTRDRIDVAAPEYPIAADIPVEVDGTRATIPFTVRYDGIGRWWSDGHDAGWWIIERKTTHEIKGDPSTEWLMAGQIVGQHVAWDEARRAAVRAGARVPRRVNGVLMDFLGKTTNPRAVNPRRFDRKPIPPPSPWQVAGWKTSLVRYAEIAKRVAGVPESRAATVPQTTELCVTRYGMCRYFNICHGGMAYAGGFRRTEGKQHGRRSSNGEWTIAV